MPGRPLNFSYRLVEEKNWHPDKQSLRKKVLFLIKEFLEEPFFNLISKIESGDHQALKELYGEFKARVYNTSLSYLQNAEEAEEVTQDVFIEVFKSAGKFRRGSSVGTWIYRITVNKSLDSLRHRNRKKRAGFLISIFKKESVELQINAPHFNHPGVELENQEKARILFAVIDKLPENQKTAFILSQVEELPQKEVAMIMKTTEKAVESLLQRAKASLRKNLEIFNPNRRNSE